MRVSWTRGVLSDLLWFSLLGLNLSFGLFSVCSDVPLGAAYGGLLPVSSFSASNSSFCSPSQGRLNGLSAWCAIITAEKDEYLQVDLGIRAKVCGVGTQGCGPRLQLHDAWGFVRSYNLSYSKNGFTWSFAIGYNNMMVSMQCL